MEEPPPPLAAIDPSQPYALRMTLIRRYWHINLKLSNPFMSESGKYEASWIGGDAVADSEAELLAGVLDAMGDRGDVLTHRKVVWAALTGPDAHGTPFMNPAIPARTTS